MRGRVGRDEVLLPVRRGALAVMTFERLAIVLGVVAEHRPAGLELAPVPHEYVPIMMADLVAEMAKHAAIWLVQLRPAPLALGAVGLCQRNRHNALVVAGHDLDARTLGRVGQKLEGETVAAILGPRLQGQAPAQQTVKQAMFGQFQLTPGRDMGWIGKVGDGVVMSAGDAELAVRARRQHPVADVMVGVGAKAPRRAVRFQGRPVRVARGLHRRDDFELGNVAKPVAASATRPILEIDDVVASLASKQFHEGPPKFADERNAPLAGLFRNFFAVKAAKDPNARTPLSAARRA